MRDKHYIRAVTNFEKLLRHFRLSIKPDVYKLMEYDVFYLKMQQGYLEEPKKAPRNV